MPHHEFGRHLLLTRWRDWVARTACWSHVHRVLRTHDQVHEYELPAAAGKTGDPRWAGFARRYGLDPTELQRLVLAAVAPYIDQAVLRERIAEEERQRRQLRAFAERWPQTAHPAISDSRTHRH
ncbi:hypothetical protein [Streptomyces lydicus]|uniref:hypothetical protein n=1 Tax=Streptomyces lydicus TaxID=47763 RepID=UPI0037877708